MEVHTSDGRLVTEYTDRTLLKYRPGDLSVSAALKLEVGTLIKGRELVITPERVQWYGDGTHSAATGELRRAGENIHTDVAYAAGPGPPHRDSTA